MNQLIFLLERRRIFKEQFQKLKDEFLTEEQNLIVELEELPDHHWPIYRPKSGGFTQVKWKTPKKDRVDWICVCICLPRQKDLGTLLRTIAHEFAHVYLAFNNPTKWHDDSLEQNRHNNYFFEYLVKNFKNKN